VSVTVAVVIGFSFVNSIGSRFRRVGPPQLSNFLYADKQ
jgi:hypothetical protein